MLSKLNFFAHKQSNKLNEIKAELDISALIKILGSNAREIEITQCEKGTLGCVFKVLLDGQSKFLKTHLLNEVCKENLSKEIDFLSFLYGDDINLQSFQCNNGTSSQIFLMMDELVYPQNPLDINQAIELVNCYSIKLQNYHDSLRISATENLACLVVEGNRALRNLVEKNLLGRTVEKKVHFYFSLLKKCQYELTPCICHGDFGPKNIMSKGSKYIVIDWEDAFWGIEGYDYLYWLTFFENRKFYSQNIFGRTPWDKPIEVAILILILILKCELSIRTNSYQVNSLTFDQRICEILELI